MSLEIKANIDEMVKTAISSNEINKEDVKPAKICLACLYVGCRKKEVRKVTNIRNLEPYWSNLKASGYFNKDGTVNIAKDFFKDDIQFILMVLTAKGFVKTHFENEEDEEAKP